MLRRHATFERTITERAGDTTISLRPMSYNVPGHEGRLEVIRERIQRELLDLGAWADMKSPNVLGMDRLQVRAFYAAYKLLRGLTPEGRLAGAIVQTSNDAFARADKALIGQWERNYG